ncbi:uncharacterized protein LOC126315401 [Schistocerca gregaria]|uniref:uncharacterized protein LOC126315401 n=1 Tax=Schistocerca gregaria TaxID=7010 RepID=UPI00211F3B76|nr:uncharacterized protein LOC126315401 [Schistocerca gregaria]
MTIPNPNNPISHKKKWKPLALSNHHTNANDPDKNRQHLPNCIDSSSKPSPITYNQSNTTYTSPTIMPSSSLKLSLLDMKNNIILEENKEKLDVGFNPLTEDDRAIESVVQSRFYSANINPESSTLIQDRITNQINTYDQSDRRNNTYNFKLEYIYSFYIKKRDEILAIEQRFNQYCQQIKMGRYLSPEEQEALKKKMEEFHYRTLVALKIANQTFIKDIKELSIFNCKKQTNYHNYLTKWKEQNPERPNTEKINALAFHLNMTPAQVKTWFNNHSRNHKEKR